MAKRKTPSRGNKPDKLISDELRKVVNERIEKGKWKGTKKLRRVAERIVDNAMGGDAKMIAELNNRLEGKPVAPIDFHGTMENETYEIVHVRWSDDEEPDRTFFGPDAKKMAAEWEAEKARKKSKPKKP